MLTQSSWSSTALPAGRACSPHWSSERLMVKTQTCAVRWGPGQSAELVGGSPGPQTRPCAPEPRAGRKSRSGQGTQMTLSVPSDAAPSLLSSPGGIEGWGLRDPQSAGLPRAPGHGGPALLQAALPVAGAEPQPGALRRRGLPVGRVPLPVPSPPAGPHEGWRCPQGSGPELTVPQLPREPGAGLGPLF